MILCAFSKSETLTAHILDACPLALSCTTAKKCPCRKRLYNVGPIDLRVLSCTFPNDWKGKAIRNPEALADILKKKVAGEREDKKRAKVAKQPAPLLPPPPPAERFDFQFEITETNMDETTLSFDLEDAAMADENDDATDAQIEDVASAAESTSMAKGASTAVVVRSGGSVWDRIADPMEFVKNFGTALYASKMFGCHNAQQGMVFALAILSEKSNPIAIKRRYHIIGGNLTMRADAMLAEFRMNFDGAHEIVERTAEAAEIELKRKGQKPYRLRFAWDDALKEPFVWGSPDKQGKREIKTNYATPRARMQMLWARVASDAVRAYCPEVNAGVYTPEEIAGVGPGGDIEDAEFTVVKDPVDMVAHAKPANLAPPKSAEPVEDAPFADRGREAAAADIAKMKSQNDAKSDVKKAEVPAQPAEGISGTTGKVSRATLVEIKAAKDALKYGDEIWKKVLDKFGVTTAKDLDQEGGERILAWLHKRKNDIDAAAKQAAGKTELDNWANGAVNPAPQNAGGATPAK